jgi:hypothetical protein
MISEILATKTMAKNLTNFGKNEISPEECPKTILIPLKKWGKWDNIRNKCSPILP